MKKYDWKNEYNPIRRTAKRLLSGEPLTDGRPLSDLIELDEHTRKCLAFEATLTDRQIDMLQELGYRTDLTSSQVGTKLRTDETVAQGFGIGKTTVQRYIRLTELIPPILQMVDEGQIALTPAVELSFLKKDEQENLRITMESEDATPSLSQAQRMKKLSQMGRLDMDTIFAIMTEEKANQRETVKIGMDKLRKYFPRGTTPKQIEDTILRLLERELQRKRNRDSR